MTQIRDHYESLLASVYTWVSGGLDVCVKANRDLFRKLDIRPGTSLKALDLGAGSGFQSIALAELGFQVTSVDQSPTLLAELKRNTGTLPIRAIHRDFFPLATLVSAPVELVVCMGDTLTLLADAEAVQRLFTESAAMLGANGQLLLTWRDLSKIPEGDARLLPVRSDANRIFTCFLESVDPSRVRVNDILHERAGDGFNQRISSYTKLRLSAAWVDEALTKAGFEVESASVDRGLIARLARKKA